jgi:hypothetical protein
MTQTTAPAVHFNAARRFDIAEGLCLTVGRVTADRAAVTCPACAAEGSRFADESTLNAGWGV